MSNMKNIEFAERFKQAVANSGVEDTQEALSRLLGVSGVMIWSYRTGEKLPRMATAVRIADKLNVDVNWLLTGKRYPQQNVELAGMNLSRKIPLISNDGIAKWLYNKDQFENKDAKQWLYQPNVEHGSRTFAFEVSGDSMTSPYPTQKSYYHGTIIYVDPDKTVVSGCKVVACTQEGEYVFKTYIEDMGKRYLKAINPQYPMVEITDDMVICGVVIGAYVPE